MATLTAHGKELARFTRTTPGKYQPDVTYIETMAYMTDRWFMIKTETVKGTKKYKGNWRRHLRLKNPEVTKRPENPDNFRVARVANAGGWAFKRGDETMDPARYTQAQLKTAILSKEAAEIAWTAKELARLNAEAANRRHLDSD